jgi:ATP-dependent exoDNAse (exonuclease V) alpha subunit
MQEQQINSNIDEIELTEEFQRAFNILEGSRDNLFVTGRAGTGKSTFLEYFRQNTKKNIAVVAPTGVAALNVRGQTIHSFFKFKPRLMTRDKIHRKGNRKVYENLDLLIIDEISMVRADVFDAIEYFLRLNGPNPGENFGGVQICVIGDLYQLSPIVSQHEKDFYFNLYRTPFFFGSEAFDLANFGVVELWKIFRQKEAAFIEALNKIRSGEADSDVIDFINQRAGVQILDNDPSIILTTTNRIADVTNSEKLAQIKSLERLYMGKANGDFELKMDKLPAPMELKLKHGAQVMFTRNYQGGKVKKWVNGTIGIIKELGKDEIIVTVSEDGYKKDFKVKKEMWESVKYSYDEDKGAIEEEIIGEYKQFPLMPAWAITIHKSQGKTLEKVVIDLGYGAFAPGQLYVALSRCRTFSRIFLKKRINLRDVKFDNNVAEFTREFIN